ncbi:MAG: hypothetical protein K0S38_614 [Candidatus Paceibacter sp.]|jgi:hypothetical protein|nr:hypothetical protein [Candidatus Paceibacter sp.]
MDIVYQSCTDQLFVNNIYPFVLYIKGPLLTKKLNFMWQQWLNVLAGLWLILSAYLGFTVDTMVINLTVTGIVVAGLALWGALEHNTMTRDERMHRHA